MTGSLVIVGAGGHGREALGVARSTRDWDSISFVDDGPVDEALLARAGGVLRGTTDFLAAHPTQHVIAVGDPLIRRRIADRIGDRAPATVLVDAAALVGEDVEFAPGVMAYPGSICTTNVRIGCHSHLNCGAIVSHDCRVGAFVSLSPGVMLNGNVVIEDGAFLGTGAIVLPGRRIGQGATVGAGSVVRHDVAPGSTVVGVPAQRIDREIALIAT